MVEQHDGTDQLPVHELRVDLRATAISQRASGWRWLDMDSKVPIKDFRPLCARSASFKDDNLPIFSSGVNCSQSFKGNFDQQII